VESADFVCIHTEEARGKFIRHMHSDRMTGSLFTEFGESQLVDFDRLGSLKRLLCKFGSKVIDQLEESAQCLLRLLIKLLSSVIGT
jgi:hypothetical protein